MVGCRDGEVGAFLIKSVRMAPLSLYIGSEMLADPFEKPNVEELLLWGRNLEEEEDCLFRLAPMRQMLKMAMSAPRARPGKKPATMARAGKALHVASKGTGDMFGEEVEDELGELVEEESEVVEETVDKAAEEPAGEIVGVEDADAGKDVCEGALP